MVAEVVALSFLVAASFVAGYYLVFTLLGLGQTKDVESRQPLWHSFAILIPAHNEEALLPRCLRTIPNDPRVTRIVVADNCTDTTARLALETGAMCVVRDDLTRIGKGYALAHGLCAAFAARPDAILILDADCELAPHTLKAFDAALASGGKVVQAPLRMRVYGDGDSAYVAAVGAEVDDAVLRGWHRMGGSVPLRGTGMLFRRDVLETHPWSMHGLAEDAEFTAVLRRAGVRVNLLEGGAVLSEAPTRTDDLLQQRRRWRAALTVPGLGLVNRIVTSKPLILGHLILTTVLVLALPVPPGMIAWVIGILIATALVYLRAMLNVGFRRPGLRSAVLVARLAGLAVAGFWKREAVWQRTPRV